MNGGISPSYQWWLNGAEIPGATGSTYTTNTLADGDDVYVTMNSSVPCAINPATSNAINISLLPVPTISTPLTDQIYCQGVVTLPIPLAGGPAGVVFDITGGTAIGLSNQTGVAAIPSFTPAAGSALITVTPRANNCTGTPATYNILVNPAPTVISPGNQVYCAGVSASPIPLNGTPSDVVFDITGGAGISDYQIKLRITTIPAFTPVTGTAIVTLTPRANNCNGTPVTFNITCKSGTRG